MGVPGVNVIAAASFLAAIGDIHRFQNPRKLVGYLWSAVRQPGPLHAFYERIRARRGHSVAIVAAARKLACLFWALLARQEDYAYAQPSLTKKKLRRLEITAGAPRYSADGTGIYSATARSARPSASSPTRPRSHTQGPCATGTPPRRTGWARARHPGRASKQPSKGKAARQTTSP